MIIDKDRFNNATEEEIKNWCIWYNNNVEPKFATENGMFCIGEGIKIPLGIFSYKTKILREYFMTTDEIISEVQNGNIKGITTDGDKLIF